jgi:hypothetical protein
MKVPPSRPPYFCPHYVEIRIAVQGGKPTKIIRKRLFSQ